jgi:hypothetical protein
MDPCNTRMCELAAWATEPEQDWYVHSGCEQLGCSLLVQHQIPIGLHDQVS